MGADSLPGTRASPLRAAEELRRRRDGERTAAGCALLAVGVLILWVSVLLLVAIFLEAIGLLLLILGSQSFGRRHQSHVWTAFGLVLVALIAVAVLPGFAVNQIGSTYGYNRTEDEVQAAFGFAVYSSIGIGTLTTLALVLLCVSLLDRRGKVVVALAGAIQLAMNTFLELFVIAPVMHQAIAEAFASTPPNFEGVDAAASGLGVYAPLYAVPGVLFAIGFFWAFWRVERGAMFPRADRPPLPWKLEP